MLFIKILIILILSSLPARAEMWSAGTYVPYFLKMQINDSGDTQKFDTNPYIGLSTQIHLDNREYFVPEIGYAYFLNNNDDASRKEIIFLHYNFAHVVTSTLLFRYGFTTHWYRVVGKGGTSNLKNGDGYTEFKNPDETRTSYFTTFNLGLEYFFKGKEYSLRFDLNTMAFTEYADREQNYLLTINFYR